MFGRFLLIVLACTVIITVMMTIIINIFLIIAIILFNCLVPFNSSFIRIILITTLPCRS